MQQSGYYRFTPRRFARIALAVAGVSSDTICGLCSDAQARANWRELSNKLQTFSWFEHSDTSLGVAFQPGSGLPHWVDTALRLESFEAVWVLEGLGHYNAEMVMASGGSPRASLEQVSPRALVALHAGMGLSIAERFLGSGRFEIARFEKLSRDCSIDGYAEVVHEALGLVARNLYPHLVLTLAAEMPPRFAEFFWHGVGRAIYFSPANFPPVGSPGRRALLSALSEPPDAAGRLNSVAGLAWAMFLVNLRHPEVLETFLHNSGNDLPEKDSFANGINSARTVWRVLSGLQQPGDAIGELFRYHPHEQGVPQ